jgi:drug/metabolite transporter (DMT)-like permease
VFKEAVSRRAWWAIAAVTAASMLLSFTPDGEWAISWSALAVLAACVFWGIDNNFTRNISARNPVSIVMVKGLVAGSFSLGLALALGNSLPGWGIILKALLLGSLSYGVSITLFIHAMRGLGAARTSALFGTAPLVGVALSFLLLQESVNWMFLLAFPLMAVGAFLLVSEEHDHSHLHELAVHEHLHRHNDEHHLHAHEEIPSEQAHSHTHTHEQQEHTHHHMPDIHHRHGHEDDGAKIQ